MIVPNDPLFVETFGLSKFTWLNALNASARICRVMDSASRKTFPTDTSAVHRPGPYSSDVFAVPGLSVAFVLLQGRGPAVAVVAALLVAGTVATVNPLMNHWYFIGVRPAAMRGAAMPVPAGHRTYESENLTGIASGPYVEQLTDRRLGAGDSVRVVGPAAIVVLDGQASITASGRTTGLSPASGMTIGGGTEATVQPGSGSTRVLLVQLLPAS